MWEQRLNNMDVRIAIVRMSVSTNAHKILATSHSANDIFTNVYVEVV